jgi:hypothetical protein
MLETHPTLRSAISRKIMNHFGTGRSVLNYSVFQPMGRSIIDRGNGLVRVALLSEQKAMLIGQI